MRNMHVFDVKTLRAQGGKDAKTGYDLDRRLLRPAVAVLRHARRSSTPARRTCTTRTST